MIKLDLLKYLNWGAIGVGLGLAGLAYNLLMKAFDNPNVSRNMINLIWLFMIFSAIIVILAFIKEFYDRARNREAINEVNPADPKIWGNNGDFEFKWFNAPFGLATKELGEMNMNKIKNKGVKYKFLLVEGNDEEGREVFKRRFDKMKKFLVHMKENSTPLFGNIEVRVKAKSPLPSITFYLLKKNNRDAAIFYLGLCIEDDKAWKAFQTQNEAVIIRLNHEFQDYWDKADEIKLEKLLE